MNRTTGLYGWWREALGAAIVLVTRILTMPRTPWENDEFLFLEGVREFDPSKYHPHPPGFPLFILLGKAFDAVFGDPFRGLVALGVVSSVIGFVAMARTFRHWIGDANVAVSGALLFYFSASMLVHSTLAMSDGPAVMFVALALLAVSRMDPAITHDRNAIAFGLACSAAIGCRPQLVVPVIPLMIAGLVRLSTNRKRIAFVAAFGFLSLMWFLPLMDAAGGWSPLMAYETKQAAYFASHDAAMSRGAKSVGEIANRFLLHPWGTKYLTIPLLLCLLLGARRAWEVRRALLPAAIFTAVQFAFELASMDPADGPRYSLPAMIMVAFLVACGFEVIQNVAHLRAFPWIAAGIFAIGSFAYVRPIIAARTSGPSPVTAAAAYANGHFAPDTVILYELSLRPHAEYLLSKFKTMPIEPGLKEYFDRSNVPLVLFADGSSKQTEAHVFSWPASDAYGKITRNLYRQVTLDPVRPDERYLPVANVYNLERTVDGLEWRWLAANATLRLPRTHGPTATLGFGLSPDAPYASNRVRIFVNGIAAGETNATRNGSAMITIPLPSTPSVELNIVSEQSFAPATVLHNQDPRVLAVQLVHLTS